MKELLHFGFSKPINRSDSGALLSREIEKISDFLRRHGLLIAECFDSHVVISHPDLVEGVKAPLLNVGLQPLMIGATLTSLRKVTSLTIAETRVMEVLSPGSLIVERDSDFVSDKLPVTIPDNYDLRDICCTFNGVMKVFIWKGDGGLTQLESILRNIDLEQCDIKQLGVLESPLYEEGVACNRATIVRISGPGDVKYIVEGTFDLKIVNEASKNISLWEIGEWT